MQTQATSNAVLATASIVAARTIVRCEKCQLVQFMSTKNRCRKCFIPFVVAAPEKAPEPALPNNVGQGIASGVRHWRQQRALTQKELAMHAQLPRTYISRIENGRILPGISTLERVAKALGIGLMTLTGQAPRDLFDAVGRDDIAFLSEVRGYFSRLSERQREQVLDRAKELAEVNGWPEVPKPVLPTKPYTILVAPPKNGNGNGNGHKPAPAAPLAPKPETASTTEPNWDDLLTGLDTLLNA